MIVKCFDHNDQTNMHNDNLDCNWNSYEHCTCFDFSLVDSKGAAWSVCVLTNSRKQAGQYYVSKTLDLACLTTRFKAQLKIVDEAYEWYLNKCLGNIYGGLDHRLFYNLWIASTSQWEEISIGANGQTIWSLSFPARVTRLHWLSTPITIVQQSCVQGCLLDQLIRLAVLASFSWSFHCFYYSGDTVTRLGVQGKRSEVQQPLDFLVNKSLIKEFGTVTGGLKDVEDNSNAIPRAAPSGVHMQQQFVSKDGESFNKNWCSLIATIKPLAEWVASNDFRASNLKAKFKLMKQLLSLLRSDLGLFHLR